MSEAELARSYQDGEITRRGLIRTLMGTGASLVAATAFADALDPQSAKAAANQSTNPHVTGLSPSSGPTTGGTTVVISGRNLGGATAVHFGGHAGTIQRATATSVTVTSPKHAKGHVDVTVTTDAGKSTMHGADRFHYVHHLAPRVTGVFPANGPQSGGTSVTITGEHFTHHSTVKFGTRNATGVQVPGTETITCVSPLGSGVVDVVVINKYGTSPLNPPDDHFTYTDFTPTPPHPTPTPSCSSCSSCSTCSSCTPICTVFSPNAAKRTPQQRKTAATRRKVSPLKPRRKA